MRHMDQPPDYCMQDGEKVWQLAKTSDFTDATEAADIDAVSFPPGVRTPPRYHRTLDEAFFVVSGEGRIRLGEETIELRAGCCVVARRGTVHSFETTQSPLTVLCICVPRYDTNDEHLAEKN